MWTPVKPWMMNLAGGPLPPPQLRLVLETYIGRKTCHNPLRFSPMIFEGIGDLEAAFACRQAAGAIGAPESGGLLAARGE